MSDEQDAGQPQRSGGRRIGEHDGDLNADDDRIEEHGRQGRHDGQTLEADVPQFVSHNTGQQGGQGAKDNIYDGGAQQVCQETAQHPQNRRLAGEQIQLHVFQYLIYSLHFLVTPQPPVSYF